jgi:hypothetical protein
LTNRYDKCGILIIELKLFILIEPYKFLAHDLRSVGQIDGEVEPRITCAACKKGWRQYEAILGNHNIFLHNLLVILCKYLWLICMSDCAWFQDNVAQDCRECNIMYWADNGNICKA